MTTLPLWGGMCWFKNRNFRVMHADAQKSSRRSLVIVWQQWKEASPVYSVEKEGALVPRSNMWLLETFRSGDTWFGSWFGHYICIGIFCNQGQLLVATCVQRTKASRNNLNNGQTDLKSYINNRSHFGVASRGTGWDRWH